MSSPRKSESLVPAAPRSSELAVAEPTLYLPKVEVGRLLGILLRRGWLIVLGMVVAVAAMFFYVKSVPKVYVSTGSVRVSSHAPRVLNIEGLAPEDSKDLEQLRTIESDMKSSAVLDRVAKANGLYTATDFAPAGSTELTVIQLLAHRIHVELLRGTR